MKSKILLVGASAALLSMFRERLPNEEVEAISEEEANKLGAPKPIELEVRRHFPDLDLRQLGGATPPPKERFKGYQSSRRRY